MPATIQIKSLTPTYDKVEDRIRLCANYQDIQNRIDFMVTRAFMIDVLFSLDKYLLTYYPKQVISDKAIQTTRDTTKPTETNNSTSTRLSKKNITNTVNEDIELYKNTEDLLVNLQIQYNKTNQLTTIEFTSKQNHQATLVLDALNFQQILWSIKRTIPTGQWAISL